MHKSVLRRWIKELDSGAAGKVTELSSKNEQSQEIERLKRELARVKIERDIKKKSARRFREESIVKYGLIARHRTVWPVRVMCRVKTVLEPSLSRCLTRNRRSLLISLKSGNKMVWQAVVERFEQQAPASVMAGLALEQALPAHWIDEVFETHRQRQYPRELLFSTVVKLMTLVSLGLRPSLHAAARKLDERLPVSLAALYDKVNRCEPAVLRARRAARAGAGQRAAGCAVGREPARAGQSARLATARSGRQPLACQ